MGEFTVTDVQQAHTLTRGGKSKPVIRAYFETAKGADGFIEVSAETWKDTERIKALLQEAADDLDKLFPEDA